METYTARLIKLTCESTSDLNASDEAWMMIQVDAGPATRYPITPASTVSLKPEAGFDTWQLVDPEGVHLEVPFTKMLNIYLWDQDVSVAVGQSDFLGSTGLTAASNPENDRKLTNGRDAIYWLTWEAVGDWPDQV